MASKASRLVNVILAGRIDYGAGLKLQNKLSKQHDITNFVNYLLLLEHNPVYTIGIRTKNYTKDDEYKLITLGAEFYRTNRGGLITFHGPGQLVAYPIINLKNFNTSMRSYVRSLERTVIDTCSAMGVNGARTTSDTGVWVGENKICAIGVHGSRYVTTHGVGLNCNTDLSWFQHIAPCGIANKGVTSLSKELGKEITTDDVIDPFLECFGSRFECVFIRNL